MYTDDHPIAANTIALAPHRDKWTIEELELSAAASPGHMMEKHLDTTQKIRKKSVEDDQVQMLVLLDDPENNKDWDDAYSAGDFAPCAWVEVGFKFVARIDSSGSISELDSLEVDNGGIMKAAGADTATANVARFQAQEAQSTGTTSTATATEVLIKVERFC